MATAIEGLRAGSGANSTALQRWAQALSRTVDGENPGVPLTELFRQTGVPLGSPFGQWAMRASLRADNRFGPGVGSVGDLLHQLGSQYQKLPAGSLEWAEDVAPFLDSVPVG